MAQHVHIAIVGAGFGGLGMAIRLRQRGIDDFVIFERADDVGGTWRANTYPGCSCDVPSHLYSFSFALNPHWSRSFSPQPEIWDYLRGCAERYGVNPHIRLGHELLAAAWDEPARRWEMTTSRGRWTADILISAAGPLSEPATPDLPGLESFAGTAFHSAEWRHDYDLARRDIAVIGTGASAIQFVPQIAPDAGRLRVFQRTAPWLMTRRDRRLSRAERWTYRNVPGAQRLARAVVYWVRELSAIGFLRPKVMRLAQKTAIRQMHRVIKDPALRTALTPTYTMGCKRVLLSNDYLPALNRSNVDVITSRIREVRPHAVVTEDGVQHPADTIIFGTGFHVTDIRIAERIRGRDGQTLADVWKGSPKAYLGTSVAGFPNLFLLLGPNTGLGHTSVVVMAESQIEYALRALRHLRRSGAAALEPRPEAQQAFVTEMDRRMQPTVWLSGGCSSWYLDSTGRNPTIWPGYTFDFRLRLRRFRPADHVFLPRAAEAPV